MHKPLFCTVSTAMIWTAANSKRSTNGYAALYELEADSFDDSRLWRTSKGILWGCGNGLLFQIKQIFGQIQGFGLNQNFQSTRRRFWRMQNCKKWFSSKLLINIPQKQILTATKITSNHPFWIHLPLWACTITSHFRKITVLRLMYSNPFAPVQNIRKSGSHHMPV